MLAIALFAVAFAVRALAGAAFAGPAYPDSYYYAHVAQQLAAGHGFVTQYVWNLDDIGGVLPVAAQLPAAANGYWMPLAELVQVPFIWLLSATPLAAALPFWVIGALAAPITYFAGREAGFSRGLAFAAGLLVCAPAGLTPFMAQPDSFGLFMTLGVLALWLCARGAQGDRRSFVAGGVVVGLAALTRIDGLLLGLPFAIVGTREIYRSLRGRPVTLGWLPAIACATVFALVVAPWLLRQLSVFGSVMPGGGTVWLTDYGQLFSFDAGPTFESWLAQGLGPLVATRVNGLLSAVGLVAIMPLAFVLAPLAIVGGWVNRASPAFRPYFIYGASLFGVMVLAFAVLIPHGTFLHAITALVPHTFLLVIAGTVAAVRWAAARRPSWSVETATRAFVGAAVAIAFMAGAVQTVSTTQRWSDARDVQTEIASRLRDAPAADRFMAVDPGAINHLTGRQGIVTPHDELPVIEDVMRAYDVRWLVLESDSIVPSLAPVLTGSVRPEWLSQPIALVANDSETALVCNTARTIGVPEDGKCLLAGLGGSPAPAPVPAAALYAVCLEPADTRCAQ